MASVPIAYALERKAADQRLEPRAQSLKPRACFANSCPGPSHLWDNSESYPSIVTALRLHRMD